ncbi:MAG: hypothetical protein Q8P41_07110 [Pseudomonadota bacterium]|nr:hypothetical protein [Pseudomonadota bacterium]
MLVGTHTAEALRETLVALRAGQAALDIYQRGGRIVRVVRNGAPPLDARPGDAPPAPSIREIGRGGLAPVLSDAATFYRLKERRGRVEEVPCNPPKEVIDALLDPAVVLPLRRLEGIVTTPMLRRDGSVVDSSGYDAATGVYLELPPALTVRTGTTPEDARAALTTLKEPFADFPFRTEADRSAALSMILTIVGGNLISGSRPVGLSNAATPKTGKTLKLDVIGIIALGRGIPRMIYSASDAEMRKVMTTLSMAGTAVALFDNVADKFGGAALDAVTTNDGAGVADRIMGGNTLHVGEMRAFLIASGNGMRYRGDMASRVIVSELYTDHPHPEHRSGFKYPDLTGHVRANRARYLGAALTILRAYLIAGQPKQALAKQFGAFKGWSDLIRGALVWAGAVDPYVGADESDADVRVLEWAGALAAWQGCFGERPMTSAEVAVLLNEKDISDESKLLRESLADFAFKGTKLDSSVLGCSLRGWCGRKVGRYQVLKAPDKKHNAVAWYVKADPVYGPCLTCGSRGRRKNGDGFLVCDTCVFADEAPIQ